MGIVPFIPNDTLEHEAMLVHRTLFFRAMPLALAPLLLLVGSCASTEVEHAADTGAAHGSMPEGGGDKAAKEPDPDKIADAEHKLSVSKAKLEIALMEMDAFERQQAIDLGHADADVQMAQANLANFEKVKAPNRKATAEMSLQGAKDQAVEAAEELQQLEIMYKDQDLHDMTQEFVISRGKRRAQRAERRIAIQEKDYASILEHELPMERKKLEISLRKAEEKFAKTKLDGEMARRGKEIKILESENAVKQAERGLRKAKEGGDK